MDFENYTLQAAEIVLEAENLAKKWGHLEILPEHLFSIMLEKKTNLQILFTLLEVDLASLQQTLQTRLAKIPQLSKIKEHSVSFSRRLILFFRVVEREKKLAGESLVQTYHFLLASLVDDDMQVGISWFSLGITYSRVSRLLVQLKRDDKLLKEEVLPPKKEDVEQEMTSSFSAKKEHFSNASENEEERASMFDELSKYTSDLTELAKRGELDPVIGRDDEIRWMMQILSRRTKNNPLLIGEAGIGKTAILHGLAYRIVDGDVPQHLKDKRLLILDFGALIAGAKYRGEFEERFKEVLQGIIASKGQVILVIPDLHLMVGSAGGQGGVNASNLLKPALLRGEVRSLSTTNPSDYRQKLEKDGALNRLFQPLWVEEPSFEESVAILRGLKSRYESHHSLQISDAAIRAAVRLSKRYVSDRSLPDKAIDLLDEASSRLRLSLDSMPPQLDDINRRIIQLKVEEQALLKEKNELGLQQLEALRQEIALLSSQLDQLKIQWELEKKTIIDRKILKEKLEEYEISEKEAERTGDYERAAEIRYNVVISLKQQLKEVEGRLQKFDQRLLKEEIDEDDISQVISDWTGIPVAKMMESEREKLLSMGKRLEQRVVGQNRAIEALTSAVRRSRSGLADPNKPIGSFLFLGPTGVGKTELAKALAEFLFDDEQAIIRLDMSEFMEKHTVSRLLGSPPGYAGHEEGGQLTEAVRQHPYSVVLFDEMEKAHQDVFNLLLQLLDDGRLTDSHGYVVDFKNTVVIMTSNVGAEHILELEDDAIDAEAESLINKALRAYFRPEFLNRIDEVLIFKRLSFEDIRIIADIQLRRLRKLLQERNFDIEFSSDAVDFLSRRGFEPAFGARPLKRAILNEIQNPLSLEILEEKFPENSVIMVNLKDNKLSFSLK